MQEFLDFSVGGPETKDALTCSENATPEYFSHCVSSFEFSQFLTRAARGPCRNTQFLQISASCGGLKPHHHLVMHQCCDDLVVKKSYWKRSLPFDVFGPHFCVRCASELPNMPLRKQPNAGAGSKKHKIEGSTPLTFRWACWGRVQPRDQGAGI